MKSTGNGENCDYTGNNNIDPRIDYFYGYTVPSGNWPHGNNTAYRYGFYKLYNSTGGFPSTWYKNDNQTGIGYGDSGVANCNGKQILE